MGIEAFAERLTLRKIEGIFGDDESLDDVLPSQDSLEASEKHINMHRSINRSLIAQLEHNLAEVYRERVREAILEGWDADTMQVLNVSVIGHQQEKEFMNREQTEESKEEDARVDANDVEAELEDYEGNADDTSESTSKQTSPKKKRPTTPLYWSDAAIVLLYQDQEYLSLKWAELLENLQQYLQMHEELHTSLDPAHMNGKGLFLHSKSIYAFESETKEAKKLKDLFIPKTIPSIHLFAPDRGSHNAGGHSRSSLGAGHSTVNMASDDQHSVTHYILERDIRKFISWIEKCGVYIPPMTEEDYERLDV